MTLVSVILALIEGMTLGFLASIPLGPIGVLCIQRTLSRGRRAGFACGAGAATSDFVYAIAAGFSISMITNFVDEYSEFLIGAGAIVLIFLGIHMIRTKPDAAHADKPSGRKVSLWQEYVQTFFLTITNPLVLFTFLAAFSLMGVRDNIGERLMVIGGVLCGAMTWWFLLTYAVGHFRKLFTIKRLIYLNKIAGATIVALVLISLIVKTVEYCTADEQAINTEQLDSTK